MTKPESFEVTLPEWCICPITYDDYTGLEDMEIQELNEFLESIHREGFSFVMEIITDEPYFSHSNELNNLGGNVYDVVFHYI